MWTEVCTPYVYIGDVSHLMIPQYAVLTCLLRIPHALGFLNHLNTPLIETTRHNSTNVSMRKSTLFPVSTFYVQALFHSYSCRFLTLICNHHPSQHTEHMSCASLGAPLPDQQVANNLTGQSICDLRRSLHAARQYFDLPSTVGTPSSIIYIFNSSANKNSIAQVSIRPFYVR